MTTARCFGGVLDGTWRAIDGHKLLAPVMDYDYKAMTIEPDEPLRCGMRVHQYTLQKFAIPIPGGWVWFHALIGPGFTAAMVKAWLDGWMEEAGKLTKEAKMQDQNAHRARVEIKRMEGRLKNQAAMIKDLREERDEARRDLKAIRTVRDNAVAAQVRIREKMQEHLRARIKAENSLTEARRQRGAQARRAERAEAALQDPFGPGYAKDRIEALHRMLAGAQEDRQQLQEQRDFVSARLSTVIGERDEARERCNKAVVIGRRLLDQGRTFAAVHRMIDALFGR